MKPKPFPLAPPLRLPAEAMTVARYLSGYYGLHEGVVLAAILTTAGALAGGGRSLFWRDAVLGLNPQIVLTPAVLAETEGWLDFVIAPLAEEVERLRSAGGDPHALEAAVVRSFESVNSMAPDDPGRVVAVETLSRIGELAYPHLLITGLPTPDERDGLRSTLIADPSGKVLRAAISQLSEAELLRLVTDDPAIKVPSRYALLVVAPAELVAGIKSGDLLPNWCPLILPQSGGVFVAPDADRKTAEETWSGVVAKLLRIRRSPVRGLTVSAEGDAVLNAVKAYAEDAAVRVGQTKWFSWALTTCAKLAGILHLINGDDGSTPTRETWNDALQFTRWLLDMQVRSVVGFTARMRGAKPRFHPPRPTDMAKIRTLMRARPTATYRELVWSLPKRPPGHWRKHWVCAKALESPEAGETNDSTRSGAGPTPTTSPTNPTRPTADVP